MDLKKRDRGWNPCHPSVIRITVTPERVRRHLLTSVWASCLDALQKQVGERAEGTMTVELALAELIRRGVPRENIHVRKSSFRLKLDNLEYRIYKRDFTEIVASPWPADLWSVVRIDGVRFADFLQFFDAHVPEIVAEVPGILETIHERELEERKQEMARDIRKTTVRALLEKYVKPLGLSAGFRIAEDGMVSLELTRRESACLEIPLEALPEVLRNTDMILAELTAKPVDIFDEDDAF
jgi:hypothetical protein